METSRLSNGNSWEIQVGVTNCVIDGLSFGLERVKKCTNAKCRHVTYIIGT